jgi:SAM-dependent methyltransferase
MHTVTKIVRDFYEEMPFNYYGSAKLAAKEVKARGVSIYPDVAALIESGAIRSALDVGCGVGWFAHSLAYRYAIPTTGVDVTAKAIERAREVARALRVTERAEFVESDLLDYNHPDAVDLVASIGALMYAPSPKDAFLHIQQFAAPGKYVFAALYHRYGREVFLDMFKAILKTEGEEAAFQKFKAMHHAKVKDDTHLRSWFRDQVMHPHETMQTLEEVCGWLAEAGLRLLSTSINKFQPFAGHDELFEREKEYRELSRQANYGENRYFPGFFTVLAQRPLGSEAP